MLFYNVSAVKKSNALLPIFVALAFFYVNNLLVDCDCIAYGAAPSMEDIEILASLDPIALDQACVDLVYTAPDGADLISAWKAETPFMR